MYLAAAAGPPQTGARRRGVGVAELAGHGRHRAELSGKTATHGRLTWSGAPSVNGLRDSRQPLEPSWLVAALT
jgi:hypothetical protein